MNVLQLVFGLTYSNLSVYLRFGIRLIVEILSNDPLARVAIPSAVKIESFKAAFAERHPILNNCWATMDGLKLYLQQAGQGEIQERFYRMTTTSHLFFAFVLMGRFQLLFLMFQGRSMIVRLQS